MLLADVRLLFKSPPLSFAVKTGHENTGIYLLILRGKIFKNQVFRSVAFVGRIPIRPTKIAHLTYKIEWRPTATINYFYPAAL